MITYEQDPDILRWGLQLFEGDPESTYTYCCSGPENNTDYYSDPYVKEEQYDIGSSNVENDEYIARALQDQLSQMSVAEGCGSPHGGVQQLQTSVYSQNWLEQSTGSYGYGHPDEHEELDDRGPSSTCSSPGDNTNFGEVWSYSIDHSDEYDLDGEVGKRLNQMVPIPHVPKINGEIPSVDEATLDHQRLLDRLQLYELVEFKVQGDGNCQFRALSDQFYRSPEHHKFVRQQVVNQLKSCRDIYEGCVPMAYTDYLKKMSKSGEWGDHVTLQAAADSYGVKIFVITSFKDTCYIEILPNVQRSKRVVFLSFWAEVHYNSIYPEGDVPAFETKKKKQWWAVHDKHLEPADNYN